MGVFDKMMNDAKNREAEAAMVNENVTTTEQLVSVKKKNSSTKNKTTEVHKKNVRTVKRGPKESEKMDALRAERTFPLKAYVTPSTGQRYKVYCIKNGLTMEELIYMAVEKYIK